MQNDELLKLQHDSRGVVQPRFKQKCTCPAVSGTSEWVLITFLSFNPILILPFVIKDVYLLEKSGHLVKKLF